MAIAAEHGWMKPRRSAQAAGRARRRRSAMAGPWRARLPPARHLWPGRSAFDRLREGRAHRLDLPGQVFSRIHVEDIAGAVLAAMDTRRGAGPGTSPTTPLPPERVIEEAARLMGVAPPP
jgi:nucleoside-diphosphate-sugar epimerase